MLHEKSGEGYLERGEHPSPPAKSVGESLEMEILDLVQWAQEVNVVGNSLVKDEIQDLKWKFPENLLQIV